MRFDDGDGLVTGELTRTDSAGSTNLPLRIRGALSDRMDARREGDDTNNCLASAQTVLVPELDAALMRAIALVLLAATATSKRR